MFFVFFMIYYYVGFLSDRFCLEIVIVFRLNLFFEVLMSIVYWFCIIVEFLKLGNVRYCDCDIVNLFIMLVIEICFLRLWWFGCIDY